MWLWRLAVLSLWLDPVISRVFSNLNDPKFSVTKSHRHGSPHPIWIPVPLICVIPLCTPSNQWSPELNGDTNSLRWASAEICCSLPLLLAWQWWEQQASFRIFDIKPKTHNLLPEGITASSSQICQAHFQPLKLSKDAGRQTYLLQCWYSHIKEKTCKQVLFYGRWVNRCGGWKSGQTLTGGWCCPDKAPEMFNFSPMNFTKSFLRRKSLTQFVAQKCSHQVASWACHPKPFISSTVKHLVFIFPQNKQLINPLHFVACHGTRNHVFYTSAACETWQSIMLKCQQPHPMTYMDL